MRVVAVGRNNAVRRNRGRFSLQLSAEDTREVVCPLEGRRRPWLKREYLLPDGIIAPYNHLGWIVSATRYFAIRTKTAFILLIPTAPGR